MLFTSVRTHITSSYHHCLIHGRQPQLAAILFVAAEASSLQELGPTVESAAKSALINQDLHAVLQRLWRHVAQPAGPPGGSASQHLCDTLASMAATADVVLAESLSLAGGVRDLWTRDGQKGARSMRKKALVDNIKSLLDLGAPFATASGCMSRQISRH